MAYICKQLAPASAANFLALIEAELVNMGWVLHDNVSATVKVYSSNAQSGNELTQYIHFSLAGNTITLTAYMWWNNVTHAGNSTASGTRTFAYAAGGKYIIVGDKNLVLIRQISALNDIWFGHLPKRFYTKPFATLLAPCLAGNGIVMTIDDTTGFVLNQTYSICDSAGAGRWRANVTGIGAGTITVDNLGSALSAGAKIGTAPSIFGMGDPGVAGILQGVWAPTITGTAALPASYYPGFIDLIGQDYRDPDQSLGQALPPYNTPGLWTLAPFLIAWTLPGNIFLGQYGVSDEYFLSAPNLAAEDTIGVTAGGTPIDTGTATLGTNFTLQCLGKVWGINAHANKIVIIAAGTGLGQTRNIASNTADELTVGVQWDTNPNATSIFFIVDQAWRRPTEFTNIAYREVI